MADTNNNLNIVYDGNLELNLVFQDYTSDTNNDASDDLLKSALIESKYTMTWKAWLLIWIMEYMIIIK